MPYQLNKIYTADYIPNALYEIGEMKKFKSCEVLKNPNEDFEGAYILVKGAVVIKSLSDKGQEVINFILKPPFVIGEAYAVSNVKTDSLFQFWVDSEVLYVSREKLINLIKTNDEVFQFMFDYIHKNLKDFVTQSNQIVFLNADVKIAALFCEFAMKYGEKFNDCIKINFCLTHQLLGDLIGVNRSTVNRSINKLIEINIICRAGRSFVVKDLEALKHYIDEYL